MNILEWKRDSISMDFVSGLLRANLWHNAVWVIMHILTKFAHFIPINMNYNLEKLA